MRCTNGKGKYLSKNDIEHSTKTGPKNVPGPPIKVVRIGPKLNKVEKP
jgi:hypothetical protein